jgi:hypothetical protein
MNLSTQFLYTITNLALYTPETMDIILWIGSSMIFIVLMRYLFLYQIGFATLYREAKTIAAKRHILEDLILMKDIQWEMEKEIEQASLRATFQG